MMNSKLIIFNIKRLYGVKDNGVKKGIDLKSIDFIDDAYIICDDDKISEVGTGDGYKIHILDDVKLINAKNNIAMPSFIDGHTHLVHGGSREHEFIDKINGVPYLDILKSGGGILNTVKKTKETSFNELYNIAYDNLNEMLLNGVTTVEAKSGYGLDLENELKQLRVAKRLNEDHPVDIVSTYLGAHATPKEYKNKEDEYIDKCIEWLKYVKDENLAEFCDIFCEEGVFNVDAARKLFKAASLLGFKLKIHADEICDIGASRLSSIFKLSTADHLLATSDESIKVLRETNTIANLLPFTSFSLSKPFARARKMIDEGLAIEISSDFNPGSAPNNNFQLVMQLASIALKLTPIEILNAVTLNASYALNRNNEIGTIEAGKKADIVLLNCESLEYFFYRMGKNHIKHVIKNGKIVVEDGALKNHNKTILTYENLNVRYATKEDIPYILDEEKNEDNRIFIHPESHEKHLSELNTKSVKHYIIEDPMTKDIIGFFILCDIDSIYRNIYLKRIVISKKKMGYGKIAMEIIKHICFNMLYAHRLWLNVRSYNERALNLYKSTGFRQEGFIKENVMIDGKFESTIIMAMLLDEYKK